MTECAGRLVARRRERAVSRSLTYLAHAAKRQRLFGAPAPLSMRLPAAQLRLTRLSFLSFIPSTPPVQLLSTPAA